jgi:hypothetical protein
MPVPPMRAGFADHVLATATARPLRDSPRQSNVFARWETWFGALVGALSAIVIIVFVVRPDLRPVAVPDVTLAFNETRTIDVLIDSSRTLDDATVSIVASGAVELADLEDAHQVQFQTRLERGRNMLSLPVVARTSGQARLVATVEHEGRSRRIAVNVTVKPPPRDKAV